MQTKNNNVVDEMPNPFEHFISYGSEDQMMETRVLEPIGKAGRVGSITY